MRIRIQLFFLNAEPDQDQDPGSETNAVQYRLPVHKNYTCSWEWVKNITMKVQKPLTEGRKPCLFDHFGQFLCSWIRIRIRTPNTDTGPDPDPQNWY